MNCEGLTVSGLIDSSVICYLLFLPIHRFTFTFEKYGGFKINDQASEDKTRNVLTGAGGMYIGME